METSPELSVLRSQHLQRVDDNASAKINCTMLRMQRISHHFWNSIWNGFHQVCVFLSTFQPRPATFEHLCRYIIPLCDDTTIRAQSWQSRNMLYLTHAGVALWGDSWPNPKNVQQRRSQLKEVWEALWTLWQEQLKVGYPIDVRGIATIFCDKWNLTNWWSIRQHLGIIKKCGRNLKRICWSRWMG